MKKLLLVLIVPVLISCSDDSSTKRESASMNLDGLEVGQKFYYSLFFGEGYHDEDRNNFTYTGDTLELEILEATGGSYLVSERFTEDSELSASTIKNYGRGTDSIYQNWWHFRNDSLILEISSRFGGSHIMHNRALSLENYTTTEVDIIGWMTSWEYIEDDRELFTTDYKLFDSTYDRLNVYINNQAMAGDGPGNTCVYSKEEGVIRSVIYSWWTGEGYGWDKL